MKRVFEKIKKKHFKYILIILLIIPLLFFYGRKLLAAIFVTSFILLNILISGYKKNFQLPIEIEILTLGIVLGTYLFGITAGLLIAIFGTILSSAFYGYYSPFLIPMVLGNVIVALLTPYFPESSVFISGTILSIIKNTFVFFSYHILFNYHVGKNLAFSISNILLNLILFLNIAPFLYGVFYGLTL